MIYEKAFFIAIILTAVFWVGYLKLYVGEFVMHGKIKSVHERVCPLIVGNNNLCEKIGCVTYRFDLGTFCKAKD